MTTTEAADDSGYRIDLRSPADPQVVGPDGTVYHFPNYSPSASGYVALNIYSKVFSSIVDPNGNTTTFNPSSRTLTDTMGRAIVYDGYGGISWPYQTTPGAQVGSASVSLSQTNSGSTVAFNTSQNANCYAKAPNSYMGGAQAAGYHGPQVQGPTAPTVYSSSTTTLTLADGTYYALTFDANDRLVKIRYPSGGYHHYDYDIAASIQDDEGDMVCTRPRIVVTAQHECTLASGNCSQAAAATINSCQAGTIAGGESTTCYAGNSNQYGYLGLNVLSPLNEKTTYSFTTPNQQPSGGSPGIPGHFDAPLETSRTVYAAGTPRPLQKIDTTLVAPTNCPMLSTAFGPVTDGEWCGAAPATTKTTLYDSSGNVSAVAEHDVTLQYPHSILSTKDLDFSGNVLRSTTNVFAAGGIYNAATPSTAGTYHILDRIQSSTSQEAVTGKSVATANSLDGAGNIVAASSTANSSSGAISTTVKTPRNAAGDVTSFSDPMQSAGQHAGSTQLSYDPQSISGCPSLAGPGSPTKATNALSRVTLYACDAAGKLKCIQDPNGNVTRVSHDALGRVKEIDSPDGGVTTTSYSNSTPITLNRSVLQGASTGVVLDGLGRASQSTTTAPEETLCSETFYDADGNVSATNSPRLGCLGTPAANASINFAYDSLGRKIGQTNQDGTTRRWTYSGPTVTFTDEAGNQFARTSDALSCLLMVTEPNQAKTTYTYDGFGNLISVSQPGLSGESARARSFSYDALSHVLTAYNPESGNVCYGQWSSGKCLSGYDLNGNPVTKTDARGNVTTYTYDVLNRITGIYPAGSQTSVERIQKFGYDGKYENGTDLGAPWNVNAIGRLSQSSDQQTFASHYAYDKMARLVQKSDCTQGNGCNYADTTFATYDLAGNMKTLTYPDGLALTNNYDGAGRLSSVTGTHAGATATYVNPIAYQPDGTPQSITYGGGLTEVRQENNRLQTCRSTVSGGGFTYLDRIYSFTQNPGSNNCLNEANNNGNIWHITDNIAGGGGDTQSLTYDSLNRLTSWTSPGMANQYWHRRYFYDSFGNLVVSAQDTGVNLPDYYNANNQFKASLFHCVGLAGEATGYDAAGNTLCVGTQNQDAQAYVWNHSNQLGQLWKQQNNNTYLHASNYLYDAQGNRVRSEQYQLGTNNIQSWREYTYFGGMQIAERASDSDWSDHIYVNGRRFARTDNYGIHLHTHGVRCSGCGWESADWDLPFSGYTIKQGDRISWHQWQTGNAVGGVSLQFQDGTTTNWTTNDTNGVPMNQMSGPAVAWITRTADLSAFAGKTVVESWIGAEGQTGAGSWDQLFADIAIYSKDGSVVTIYSRNQSYAALPAKPTSAFMKSGSEQNELGIASFESQNIALNSRYYIADQVGTSQMEFTGDGFPVWRGAFAPFGTELSLTGTVNRYKFTGKERDAESGLDYFGARFYGASNGRFMSPDWSAAPRPVPYANLADPQSLNLYAYAGNNPLRQIDPDGHLGLNVGSPGGCMPSKSGSSCADTEAQQTSNAAEKAAQQQSQQPAEPNPNGSVPAPPPGKKPNWKRGNPLTPNEWVAGQGSKERPTRWNPKYPIPGRGQPNTSWDGPNGHWDNPDGEGNTTRWLPNGGGQVDHDNNPVSRSMMDQMRSITPGPILKWGTTGVVIYIIIDEGSRLYPPRNLIPVP